MPTAFGLNRPRLDLTGLEEPEELWDRLQEATAEAQALSATNKKLAARVRVLERQLSEVGALTDDELVAELPRRMSKALESAQGVANEIVRRARKQEGVIRQKAQESAVAIVKQAEDRATSILNQAATEATGHVAAAEAKARDVIGAAYERRKTVLAKMEDEVATLQQRMNVLRRDQSRLLHAYEVVERTLVEARTVLRDPQAVEPEAPSSRQPVVEKVASVHGRRNGAKPRHVTVYDWSPVTSSAG